jgi:hypothetical protein
MNLTTVRSHQFAVWITIGFFEVKRPGIPALVTSSPTLAGDLLGPEIGATGGRRVRHCSFFVLDRSRAGGLDQADTHCIHDVILYRQLIR